MNNINTLFFKGVLFGFIFGLIAIMSAAFLYDASLSNIECSNKEKKWAKSFPEHFVFKNVSYLFWKAQCKEKKSLLIFSASEGTGDYKFSQAIFDQTQSPSWEFRGAHRGIKTLAYVLSGKIHPDKMENLKLLAFINPVYFAFAAKTDGAAMELSASSMMAYWFKIPSLAYKFSESILKSPFKTAQILLEDFKKAEKSHRKSVLKKSKILPLIPPDGYNLTHNMLNDKVDLYKNSLKEDTFSLFKEPSHKMLRLSVESIEKMKIPACLVLLPLNEKHLQTNRSDSKTVSRSIAQDFNQIVPSKNRINLSEMNLAPYLFADSMHLTPFGIQEVVKKVIESPCYNEMLKNEY